MPLKLETGYLNGFVSQHEYEAIEPQVKTAHELLMSKTGMGNDFWAGSPFPAIMTRRSSPRIKAAAKKIQGNSDVFVVIGIGGSYLGARAAIEFLSPINTTTCARIPRPFISPATASAPPPWRNWCPCARGRCFHQYDLQVRHHHRTRHCVPGVP